mmetsp:Transcript_32355/g.32723  ORF Transcript_32355/g.32723 Transcript_32355/m.32723 type:complete len:118 (+) Transcript_32355:359-712(+)
MYSMHPMMSSMGVAIYATDSIFENETLTVWDKKWPFLPPARFCVSLNYCCRPTVLVVVVMCQLSRMNRINIEQSTKKEMNSTAFVSFFTSIQKNDTKYGKFRSIPFLHLSYDHELTD